MWFCGDNLGSQLLGSQEVDHSEPSAPNLFDFDLAELEKQKDTEPDPIDTLAPGELFVCTSKLAQIKREIEFLVSQLDCLDILFFNSSLTGGNRSQAKSQISDYILEQTRELVKVEIGELVRQKAKFESHEQREAIVPGQCSIVIEEEEESAQDAVEMPITWYNIKIVRTDTQSEWTVRRRYSDFDYLHKKLKKHFPIVGDFDLPGKTMGGLWTRQADKLTSRAKSLERYLQRLVDNPDTSHSDQIRRFLSSTYDMKRPNRLFRIRMRGRGEKAKLKKQLAKTLSQITPMLKGSLKSEKSQSVMQYIEVKRQLFKRRGDTAPEKSDDELAANSVRKPEDEVGLEQINMISDSLPSSQESIGASWSESMSSSHDEPDNLANKLDLEPDFDLSPTYGADAPILNALVSILLETFEFSDKSCYMQKNAVRVLLTDWFGDDIERRVKDLLKTSVKDEALVDIISDIDVEKWHQSLLSEIFWSDTQCATIQLEVRFKLGCFDNLFSRAVGTEVAHSSICRVFEMFQCETLNQHLAFKTLDYIVSQLPPAT